MVGPITFELIKTAKPQHQIHIHSVLQLDYLYEVSYHVGGYKFTQPLAYDGRLGHG